MKILANENVPLSVITTLRSDGHDVSWIKELVPGSTDDVVLTLAFSEGRVLLTFDKDFGEMAFHQGRLATPGVILLRPRLRSPAHLARFAQTVLAQPHHWEGHFAVADESRIRIIPLPIP